MIVDLTTLGSVEGASIGSTLGSPPSTVIAELKYACGFAKNGAVTVTSAAVMIWWMKYSCGFARNGAVKSLSGIGTSTA